MFEKDVGSGAGAIAPTITSDGTIYPHPVMRLQPMPWPTFPRPTMMARIDPMMFCFPRLRMSWAARPWRPRVYKIGGAATLASPVTLDAKGDPEGVFYPANRRRFGSNRNP